MRLSLILLATALTLSSATPQNSGSRLANDNDLDQFRFGSTTPNVAATGTRRLTATTPGRRRPGTSPNVLAPTPDDGDRCGEGFGSCPNNGCCSKWGWCDVGPDYCGEGCQPQYGQCGSSGGGNGGGNGGGGNGNTGALIYSCTVPGTVAITFDDGPASFTPELLDQLREEGVKVTFFVNGDNYLDAKSSEWKSSVRRAHRDGHLIASHTYQHLDLSTLSESDIRRQMTMNDQAIKSTIGVRPIYMRPPYGATNELARRVLTEMGYKIVIWDIETLDTEHESAAKSIRAYEKVLKSSNPRTKGHIGLSHDPVQSSATEFIPGVLPIIKRYGFRAVRLDECLGNKGRGYRN